MSGFTAIMASIMMLATTTFGKGWAAAPTVADKPVAYVSPAGNGVRAIGATQDRTDRKMQSAMQTSATPSAGVVLTVGRGGGAMPGRGSAVMPGGLSGRSNRGHSFNSRPFVGRPFDRDDLFFRNRFVPQHRFFDRDEFFFRFGGWGNPPWGWGNYPYGGGYYYPYGYYYGNPWYFYPNFSLSFSR